MRICVFGAGAIGGFVGGELALAGADVTLVGRGAHLAAMRERGLTLIRGGETRVARPACTEDARTLPPQDAVIVTLKAHAFGPAAEAIRSLLGPETCVVTAMNGIPYWYFHGLDGPLRDRRLATVDPGGRIWDAIAPERAVGCVLYPAVAVPEPGVVRHVEGDALVLGEPGGAPSDRLGELARALAGARLDARASTDIRAEIWLKLWGNLAFNPVSALTGATLAGICADAALRGVVRRVMIEAEAVAAALGVAFPIDVDERIAGAARVGAHKTSMLQDLEAGRPMEIDAVVGAVAEIAGLVGIATPALESVLALVRARAAAAGCLPEP